MHHVTALSNRIPILERLVSVCENRSIVNAIEIGSGTGAHLDVFATVFSAVTWQPTEYVPGEPPSSEQEAFSRFGKIGEIGDTLDILNRNLASHANVRKAKALNLADEDSFVGYEHQSFDLAHVGNVLHVCPMKCMSGLFQFASQVLRVDGVLTMYGPFKRNNQFTTPSNFEFDQQIRKNNQEFGLRDIELEIIPVAERFGFRFVEVVEMPKNIFFLWFTKAPILIRLYKVVFLTMLMKIRVCPKLVFNVFPKYI